MSCLSSSRIISRRACRHAPSLGATIVRRPCQIRFINTQPAYPGHIPLNCFENAVLAVGSAVMSLADPRRGGEFREEMYAGC
jgi:ubiquinone biosynthesis protein COQ4